MIYLKVIDEGINEPYDNLEKEKLIFESPIFESEVLLRFWINKPSVILGKFQKEEYEVNIELAKSLSIPVLRRFSGGGAVYHDEGVLNVSVFKNKNFFLYSSYFLEEAKFLTSQIAKSIEKLTSKKTTINERNGIFIEGFKVAGSSVAIGKNFLYHISILVEADIDLLNAILQGKPYKVEDKKYIKSVKSSVKNLRSIYKNITIESLKSEIKESFFRLISCV